MYASTKVHIAYIYDRFPATFCVAPALQNPPIASLRVQDRWVMVERSIFCPVSTFAWITGRFSSRSVFTGSRSSIGSRLFIGNAAARQENRLNDCLIKYVLVVEWALHCYCRNPAFLSVFFPPYLFLYFSTYGRTSWYSDIYRGWESYRSSGLKSTISEREHLSSFITFTHFVPSVLFKISYHCVLYQCLCTIWIHSEGEKYAKQAIFGSCSLTCRLRLY